MRWPEMAPEELQQQYSPSSCVPNADIGPFIEAYQSESDAAWAALSADANIGLTSIRYGELDSQTIDVAVHSNLPAPPPLLVYIHGGYWQLLSREESRFAAADALDQGWAFATIDYTLAPHASLSEIVAECCAAVRTLHERAASLGFDAGRVFVSGSSAGAHLSAMVALELGELVRGTVLVSGVFELEPLLATTINDAVGMDLAAAKQNSPLLFDVLDFPASLIAYGDNETDEFKAQSAAFAERLRAAGTSVSLIEVAGRNHFDVILDVAKPGTVLGDEVAGLINVSS